MLIRMTALIAVRIAIKAVIFLRNTRPDLRSAAILHLRDHTGSE